MDNAVRQAVARAIAMMRSNLGEHLTIDDLAHAAMFSKFHFARVFLRTTGLSPGRFLSALRLAEAKRLLNTTSTSVTDISHQVGYNSVGTFSARFSASVGYSPSSYRQLLERPSVIDERAAQTPSGSTLRGHVHSVAASVPGPMFLGLFPARIAEGAPARYTILPGLGPYTLTDVPVGTWHVIAHAHGSSHHDDRSARPFAGLSGPVSVNRGVTGGLIDIRLRPRHGFDPPILLTLPDLRQVAARDAVAV